MTAVGAASANAIKAAKSAGITPMSGSIKPVIKHLMELGRFFALVH